MTRGQRWIMKRQLKRSFKHHNTIHRYLENAMALMATRDPKDPRNDVIYRAMQCNELSRFLIEGFLESV